MSPNSSKPQLILIVGPTASGKSAVALELACSRKMEIINGDSLQAFQRLDIGTAKPSPEERALVPHHLFDFLPPGSTYTAGDFRRDVLKIVEKHTSPKPLLLVGGSGFYLQALIQGLFELPKGSESLQQDLLQEKDLRGLGALYDELRARDPEYSAKISDKDSYRILRALEILRTQQKTITELWRDHKPPELPFHPHWIGLSREPENLRRRIHERTHKMLEQGLIEETRALLREGWRDWAPLSSVGYKETIQFLDGQLTRVQLEEHINIHTSQLAKRQRTWFRRNSEIRWFNLDSDSQALAAEFEKLVPR